VQDERGKLNAELPWQQQEEFSLHQQIGLKLKKETSKVLHLKCSCVVLGLDCAERR
jgi:hypothetical protein